MKIVDFGLSNTHEVATDTSYLSIYIPFLFFMKAVVRMCKCKCT